PGRVVRPGWSSAGYQRGDTRYASGALAAYLLCRFVGHQCDHPLPVSVAHSRPRYTKPRSECGERAAVSVMRESKRACSGGGVDHYGKIFYSVEHLRKEEKPTIGIEPTT